MSYGVDWGRWEWKHEVLNWEADIVWSTKRHDRKGRVLGG